MANLPASREGRTRLNTWLDENALREIQKYCIDQGVSQEALFRFALYEFFLERGVDLGVLRDHERTAYEAQFLLPAKD